MSFWGKYGDLSAADAAKAALMEISQKFTENDLKKVHDGTLSAQERYDSGRLLRVIESLQQVIWLNGGFDPPTWLPKLFDFKNYRGKGYNGR